MMDQFKLMMIATITMIFNQMETPLKNHQQINSMLQGKMITILILQMAKMS